MSIFCNSTAFIQRLERKEGKGDISFAWILVLDGKKAGVLGKKKVALLAVRLLKL